MPVSSARMGGKFDGVLFAEGGELAQFYGRVKKALAGEKLKQFGGLTKVEEQAKFVLGLLPAAEPPKAYQLLKYQTCKDWGRLSLIL